MRTSPLPSSRIWFHATKSFRKGKNPKTILKLAGWFETNFVTQKQDIFLCKCLPWEGLLMSADIIVQKRKSIWTVCQRQKNCHSDPTSIRARRNFTIGSSGSQVFQCSKRNPLKAEKKGTKVFECWGQALSWKISPASGSESFYFMPLLNCRPTRLPSLGSSRCSLKADISCIRLFICRKSSWRRATGMSQSLPSMTAAALIYLGWPILFLSYYFL